jgi:hypothetical protein
MTTSGSESKSIAYSSSGAYVSLNEMTMLVETEKIRLTLPKPASRYDPSVNTLQEQKLPDFYELKIRVRKYDFL